MSLNTCKKPLYASLTCFAIMLVFAAVGESRRPEVEARTELALAKSAQGLTLGAGLAMPHRRSAGGGLEVEGGVQGFPATGPVRSGMRFELYGGLRAVVLPEDPPLFADGFESEDTSAWDETTQ